MLILRAAGIFLLALTLVLADVLRLDIGEQHFSKDRFQMLRPSFLDLPILLCL
jgi:hypothetical protein